MTARARTRAASPSGIRGIGQNAWLAFSARRLLAAVGLLSSAAAFYGVTTSAAFELDRLEINGTNQVVPEEVRSAALGAVGERPNLFRVRSADIGLAVRALPAVRDARIGIALPGRLVVTVIERSPIVTWETGTGRYFLDVEGRLFLVAPGDASGHPVVRDEREYSRTFELGGWLELVDLAVVRQLGALTPASLGSRTKALMLTVDDSEGWRLTTEPRSWEAIFGFYTSRSRRPDLIPAQVQCLRSLLASAEGKVERVYLGRPGERCGTYVLKESR
jgi:cell division septal protein FtsQ